MRGSKLAGCFWQLVSRVATQCAAALLTLVHTSTHDQVSVVQNKSCNFKSTISRAVIGCGHLIACGKNPRCTEPLAHPSPVRKNSSTCQYGAHVPLSGHVNRDSSNSTPTPANCLILFPEHLHVHVPTFRGVQLTMTPGPGAALLKAETA